MSISTIPTPDNSEIPQPAKGIIREDRAQRLRLAMESDEAIIRASAKNVLEAEELLLDALEEMDITPDQLADSPPLTTDQPVRLMLKPTACAEKGLPDHEEEMAEWDELYDEIQARLTRLRLLH